MTEFLLSHGSYLLIVVVLILTGSGLPLPEEIPIVAAGVLAAHDVLDPLLAVACCLLGAMAGDCMMYMIGYHFGRNVLQDHPWWVRFVTPEREAQVEQMFKQHGLKVFFLARFLVFVRSPLLLAAGILRVSFLRFLLIDLFSATVVVGAFFGLSYSYGRGITSWIQKTEVLLTVVVALIVATMIFYWWRRHVRRAAVTAAAPATDPPRTSDGSQKAPQKPEDKLKQVV